MPVSVGFNYNSSLLNYLKWYTNFASALDEEQYLFYSPYGESWSPNYLKMLFLSFDENEVYYFTDTGSMAVFTPKEETITVTDENGGKLKERVMFYMDEFGTLPAIESAEMMYSASRSRRLSLVSIIQSFQQLEKNYGKEGAAIIQDNCQITIAGGFAPTSETADIISDSLGTRTVMSGSVSKSKDNPSQSLQMIQRPLMSADELKSMKKGSFIVMKTGTHPFISKLKLFFKWGITFDKEPYLPKDNGTRDVEYTSKEIIEAAIIKAYPLQANKDTPTEDKRYPYSGQAMTEYEYEYDTIEEQVEQLEIQKDYHKKAPNNEDIVKSDGGEHKNA